MSTGWGKYGVDWTSVDTLRLCSVAAVMRELVEAVNERIRLHNCFLYQSYVPQIAELNANLMPVSQLIYQMWQAIIIMTTPIYYNSQFQFSGRWLNPVSFKALLSGDETAKSQYPFPGITLNYINSSYGYSFSYVSGYNILPSLRLRTYAPVFWALRDCLNRMIYFNTAGDYYSYVSCIKSGGYWRHNTRFSTASWDAAYASLVKWTGSVYTGLRLNVTYSSGLYGFALYNADAYRADTSNTHPMKLFIRPAKDVDHTDEYLPAFPLFEKWNHVMDTRTNEGFSLLPESVIKQSTFQPGYCSIAYQSVFGVMPVIDLSDPDTGFEFVPALSE